ncbi:hypothetical protein [Paenibacillus naphthalenovorans]|uniref:Uncharacterized protein n=1 Tax=Paenibacillus naphthalenovorans TaxID=162209 RepID=A0A0U2W3W0_9BACL|nr:hypothetical protein [Paenibacillus naphthalenovorans]ALS22093.1 hypothetical protein IJ22_17190 [Paenibacillus naphthalenovorans]
MMEDVTNYIQSRYLMPISDLISKYKLKIYSDGMAYYVIHNNDEIGYWFYHNNGIDFLTTVKYGLQKQTFNDWKAVAEFIEKQIKIYFERR